MVTEESTRSLSRERAAMCAYRFIVKHGLWIRLEDAHLIPSMEDSINQLQELYQKRYLDAQPEYFFKEEKDQWHCDCVCCGVNGYGTGTSKTKAKKKAAYMVLVRLLDSAGICKEEWKTVMWQSLSE
jgi:ribonuclease-3